MSFLHHLAPAAKPAAADLCLVIQADRLLARMEPDGTVALPRFAAVQAWSDPLMPPLHVGLLDG